MPDPRPALAEFDWQELVPWVRLIRVFRVALDPRKLILAAAAILLTAGGWWVIGQAFSQNEGVKRLIESEPPAPWNDSLTGPQPDFGLGGTLLPAVQPNTAWFFRNPVVDSWWWLSRPFRQLFNVDLSITAFVYLLVSGLWVALVWGYFGGAMTRIAALELAREDRAGFGEALRHARTKLGAYFWSPLYPLVGVALVALPMVLLGWLLRFDVGVLVGAIIWPIFLLCGLLMTIIVVGVLFGWPLMWATISAEGTDTFDAMSRAYAYVIQRPLHYLFYALVATVLGVLGWIIVAVFAAAIVHLSFWGVSWTSGREAATELVNQIPAEVQMFAWENRADVDSDSPPAENGSEVIEGPVLLAPAETEDVSDAQEPKADEAEDDSDATEPQNGTMRRAGVAVLALWIGLVKLFALAFSFSYFWTASTAIYFLMRRDVDATEMDEVYVEEEDETYTLPSLTTDTQGAPVASDEPSGQGDVKTSETPDGEDTGDTAANDKPAPSDED